MMHVGLPFPESVDVVEKECGVQPLIYVSWEVSRHRYHLYNDDYGILE